MTQIHEQTLKDLPLGEAPFFGRTDLLFGQPGPSDELCAFLEPNAIITEIRENAIAHLGGAPDGLAVGVEEVSAFLRPGIRKPDDFGGAGQVGLANTNSADLIVVRMSL